MSTLVNIVQGGGWVPGAIPIMIINHMDYDNKCDSDYQSF